MKKGPTQSTRRRRRKRSNSLKNTIDEITNSGNFRIFENNAVKVKDILQQEKAYGQVTRIEVYWFYGDTGTGKTRKAVQM